MKVLCPNHKDKTPSLHVYEDRAYCFVCRYSCPSDQIVSADELKELKKAPTDIAQYVEYIKTLPIMGIRGLSFHSDTSGFYIIWPGDNYFKKRVTIEDTKNRYIGPRGHRAPLWVHKGNSNLLVIVEGELNAMSLALCNPRYTLISPGSATELPKTLDYALTFSTIVIIVDKDIPGVGWGANLKHELIKRQKKVQLVAVEKDINQILQEEGKEGVKKWFQENVDLPGRL